MARRRKDRMPMTQPLILVDPHPRTLAQICDADTLRRLQGLGRLVVHEDGPMPAELVDQYLPEAVLIFGHTDLPVDRLVRAPKLRAIVNVETNFLPNIDYDYCFTRGIHVITPSAAFAPAVAEAALGMAIDLARGITAADRAFRAGTEQYGLAANTDSFMFGGAPIGLIGFGDLARQLRSLVVPFGNPVKAYDPWLSDHFLRAHKVEPATLDELLSTSRVIFVFAGVTSENQGFLARRELELIQPGAAFLLMSRAAVVDFPELVRQARSGRIKVAVDVFPEEPVAADDSVRGVEGILLSAHRTGGMQDALLEIGRQAVADAELILRGLAPVTCRRAQRETVGRSRSKPVTVT
jgi:phosphoglycerate dehydrogenase-like enzyme